MRKRPASQAPASMEVMENKEMDSTIFSPRVNRNDEFKTNAGLRAEHRAFFAANFKRRIQELGMNQSDLARAVWPGNFVDKRGYPQPKRKYRISVYCKGRAMPQPGALAKIAKALDTTPEALVGKPVSAPRKVDERERFTFEWGGGRVAINLEATFPEAAGREIAALITKHLEIKGSAEENQTCPAL
jgi:transcriptional regulator with XRE-family HTH domain